MARISRATGRLHKAVLLLAALALLAAPQGCRGLAARGASAPPAATATASAAVTPFARPTATPRRSLPPTAAPTVRATPTMTAPAAAATAQSTATPRLTPQPTVPPSAAATAAYFAEIAFSSEYGGTAGRIRKWAKPLTVSVQGAPTGEDMAALNRAMAGLNAVEHFPGIKLVKSGGNVQLSFVPVDKMADSVGNYEEGNWGFFTLYADERGITSAQIAIASDVTTQEARNHLIFEELLQSTGLMQDAYDYPDSIYYGLWTTVQQPTALDWELLRLLYLPALKHGMGEKAAMTIVREELGLPAGWTPPGSIGES